MAAAIADPDPVLVFEHKGLYRRLRAEPPPPGYRTPIGRAHVARPGTDATVVTYGSGVTTALAAVELPEREDRDRILGSALAEVDDEYPFVIVDCPPALGMLTVNALAAALTGHWLIPSFVDIGWLKPGEPFRKVTFLIGLGLIMGAAIYDIGGLLLEALVLGRAGLREGALVLLVGELGRLHQVVELRAGDRRHGRGPRRTAPCR